MSDFDDLLDAAVERRTTKPETETVEVLINATVVTLKFTEMDPLAYANACSAFPARPANAIDRRYGYNYHAATTVTAPLSGVRVDGDTEEPLTAEQWEKSFRVLAPHDFTTIADTLLGLNEFRPEQRLVKAKKALAVAAAKKPTSPAK